MKLLVDDDDDDAKGDNNAEVVDAGGDGLKGTTAGSGGGGGGSSAARARRRTLAICSCSSRLKWLRSSSTGDDGNDGISTIFEVRTLSIDIGLERLFAEFDDKRP